MRDVRVLDQFGDLPADEPFPGVTRRRLDAVGATVTRYAFAPGAAFPTHRHEQEQITFVDEGSVTLRVAGRERRLRPGACAVIPGGVDHGITAGAEGGSITAVIVPRRGAGDRYDLVDHERAPA